ncbi:toll/interleukin-1 receptor domain-containing protein [Streptomyces niveus]|uniref:toll/interleukin-1 receptor domain-containing protein n=1 Tax=Streptomyces niveus TaxID=193462 RepID=UPI0036A8AFF4
MAGRVGSHLVRYFVSYARRDNDVHRLKEVVALLGGVGCEVYVDDLHSHRPGDDRVKTVTDALVAAEVFVAVESLHYLATEWTRWEFNAASRLRTRMVALSSDFALVNPGEPDWPWQSSFSIEPGRDEIVPIEK